MTKEDHNVRAIILTPEEAELFKTMLEVADFDFSGDLQEYEAVYKKVMKQL